MAYRPKGGKWRAAAIAAQTHYRNSGVIMNFGDKNYNYEGLYYVFLEHELDDMSGQKVNCYKLALITYS